VALVSDPHTDIGVKASDYDSEQFEQRQDLWVPLHAHQDQF
jgi:hypothetical protein